MAASPGDVIHVKVLLFASARELAGTGECEVDVPRGSKSSVLREMLAQKFPLLGSTALEAAIAVNQEYTSVDDDPELKAGDEIALIPPISGG